MPSLAQRQHIPVYIVSGLFIVLNSLFIANEMYWFMLAPAALLVAWLALFAMDKLIMAVVFLTPLSVNLTDVGFGLGLSVPTEPILAGIMLLFFVHVIIKGGIDSRVASHPVSVALVMNLAWLALTAVTSDMPLVSLKFLVSRLWFVVAFYFMMVLLFRDRRNMPVFLWAYFIPFLGVMCYTLISHSLYGFDEESAHWVMTPFFNDHTAYGASLAFFLPVSIGFCLRRGTTPDRRITLWLVLALLCTAIVFSYTRATWVSLAGAFAVWMIIELRVRLRPVLAVLAVLAAVYYHYQSDIFLALEKNRPRSSAELTEHVQSIPNITTDASNLERINRWKSAIRMFLERPVLGWGPGTYAFRYAPFQRSSELTPISTNAGDLGNAHSEYIGPLAESGAFGALSFLLVVFATVYTFFRAYRRSAGRALKLQTLTVFLGLTTYYIHGILNNFLDTDKASALFWGFTAVLVATDIYHADSPEEGADGTPVK